MMAMHMVVRARCMHMRAALTDRLNQLQTLLGSDLRRPHHIQLRFMVLGCDQRHGSVVGSRKEFRVPVRPLYQGRRHPGAIIRVFRARSIDPTIYLIESGAQFVFLMR